MRFKDDVLDAVEASVDETDDAFDDADPDDATLDTELAVAARVTVGIWALVGEGIMMRIGVMVGNETGTGCRVGAKGAGKNCEHAVANASIAMRPRNRTRW